MLGILVHGDNHFIVRGPLPDQTTAQALTRQWSIIQIGQTTPQSLTGWTIVTKAFREDLEWAVVVPGESEVTPAVGTILAELLARGVAIRNYQTEV